MTGVTVFLDCRRDEPGTPLSGAHRIHGFGVEGLVIKCERLERLSGAE